MTEKTLKTGSRTDHQISAESSTISIPGSKSVVEVENTNGDLEQNDYSEENTRSRQTNDFTDILGSTTDEHINDDQYGMYYSFSCPCLTCSRINKINHKNKAMIKRNHRYLYCFRRDQRKQFRQQFVRNEN